MSFAEIESEAEADAAPAPKVELTPAEKAALSPGSAKDTKAAPTAAPTAAPAKDAKAPAKKEEAASEKPKDPAKKDESDVVVAEFDIKKPVVPGGTKLEKKLEPRNATNKHTKLVFEEQSHTIDAFSDEDCSEVLNITEVEMMK